MKKVFLLIIQGYQKLISPMFPPSCRFYPSCSEYAYQSIFRHGVLKGMFYAIVRVGKCHPFHPGGVDPVK